MRVLKKVDLVDSSGAVGRLVNVQVITSSKKYQKTPGAKFGIIEVQGAGGAGAGSAALTAASTCSVGAGGTCGAYAKCRIDNLEDEYDVIIGAGGLASVGAVGGDGGATSFGTISVSGGFGGATMTPGSSVNYAATNGAVGVVDTTGASSVISTSVVVQSGILALRCGGTVGYSGSGGYSVFGWGGYARLVSPNGPLPGLDGEAFGSGGSGSASNVSAGSAATPGGNGASGVVIVWEYA